MCTHVKVCAHMRAKPAHARLHAVRETCARVRPTSGCTLAHVRTGTQLLASNIAQSVTASEEGRGQHAFRAPESLPGIEFWMVVGWLMEEG